MKITKCFDLFAGKSELEQLDVMEKLLLENDFTMTEVQGRRVNGRAGCKTVFFSKDSAENVFALTCNSVGDFLPVIIPFEFAKKHYMSNGKFTKTIRLNSHSHCNAEITPVLPYEGKDNVKLHRVLMKELGIDIKGLEVDHVSCHQGVNVPEELRACTSEENKANKQETKVTNAKAFAYDSLHDFKNSFWIPFLHYVLGEVSAEGMRTLREMELNVA